MKKVLFTLMCIAAMMAAGTSLKAQEVTIVLNPGWTWISYPSTDTVDIATAFGSFTPAIGDIFKSKWGMATYIGNGQWRGAISPVFYPGYGYHYKSNRQMPVVLTINVQQPAPQVVVTTSEPMLVTAISAMGGGEVTVSDGTYIFAKGLCWAAHENPTTSDDFFEEAEGGVGSFSLSMTSLNISTTYYVRAYAVTGNGTVYGNQKTFTTRDGIPTLTTAEVTNITSTMATCGGDITDNGGLNVIVGGVCWSILPNPTITDSHTTDGTGLGSFVSAITDLTPSTTYYVRAYATNSYVTVYGNQYSFITESSGSGGDHDYVDLGLPSGTLWATCNVGADVPEDYGDYFAWGETQPQDYYDWTTYQYCNGNNCTLTKYCYHPSYGYNGFTDNLTELLPEDDAAIAQWGSEWRMPTSEEWNELLNNTTNTWVTQNGVYGRLFTATNSNCLFLPAAGYRFGSELICAGSYGYYWSSLLSTDNPLEAWCFQFKSNDYGMIDSNRSSGQPVRAVRSGATNYSITVSAIPILGGIVTGGGTYQQGQTCTVSATANTGYTFTNWTENDEVVSTEAIYIFTVDADRTIVANFTYNGGGDHDYVDLGLPSGLLWATCNVGAIFPEDNGYYFAWGETQPKGDFTYMWSTYQHCNGSYNTLTKYCNNSDYGYNGFIDNLTILQPEDDAATANWGAEWRMPTEAEWEEIFNNTTCTWATQNGINGVLFTASNGNSLFLPAAGGRFGGGLDPGGSQGEYWTSSLNTWSTPNKAYVFSFDSYGNYSTWEGENRSCGISIRAVRSTQPITPEYSITITSSPIGGGIVTGGGTYQQGQSCTVSAIAATGYTFINWTENGSVVSTNANYTFTVNGNRTLVAHFSAQAPNTYTISVSSNPTNGGTVTGGGIYQQGQSCTVSAIAATDYIFMNWTENGSVVSTNANYTFTVNGNRALVANFSVQAPNTYTISVSSNPSNGGSVTGGGTYQLGQSCTVSASANPGHTFVRWMEDGVYVSNDSIYTFTVTNSCTLVAWFLAESYVISVSANPTIGGGVTGGGSYNHGESCVVHAGVNVGYSFINWTENDSVVSTNASYTFTVNSNRSLVANYIDNGGGGSHICVDLGLPSGLLWAICNVGAETPEEYGNYYAWGEKVTKNTYNWSTYKHCKGSYDMLTKYCDNFSYGYNGFTDNLTVLQYSDDAARCNWGDNWRIPTVEEWQELLSNTTKERTTQNGVEGFLFVASNGNSLFLPVAGERAGNELYNVGIKCRYWSNSLLPQNYPYMAYFFDNNNVYWGLSRFYGLPVRPVRSAPQN